MEFLFNKFICCYYIWCLWQLSLIHIYDQLLAYYRYERDQRVINTAIHDAKNEGINEGINKGINIGIKKAKLEDAKTLISNIYHIDDFEWLDNCTLEQLDKVITIVTQSYTYQELKKEILK